MLQVFYNHSMTETPYFLDGYKLYCTATQDRRSPEVDGLLSAVGRRLGFGGGEIFNASKPTNKTVADEPVPAYKILPQTPGRRIYIHPNLSDPISFVTRQEEYLHAYNDLLFAREKMSEDQFLEQIKPLIDQAAKDYRQYYNRKKT